jgi:predicted ribosome quality control (RQC) complex YloA/Tae2 family protein
LNTASGFEALLGNTNGSFNTALGGSAGCNLTTGNYNINVGYNVSGAAGEANTTRIGDSNQTKTFISGISGVTATSGVAVYVNSSGQLGTLTSSARFKEEIKAMDQASEAILGLTPVTFRYKHDIDPDGIPQFGLVAEEVAKVNPDLVAKDAEGKVYTVRYEAVNAMLLNEFLKAHKKMQTQEQKLQSQEQTIAQLKASLDKQEMAIAQLQKNSPTTLRQQQTQPETAEMTIARAQNDGRILAASLQQQSSQIQIVSETQPTDNHQ